MFFQHSKEKKSHMHKKSKTKLYLKSLHSEKVWRKKKNLTRSRLVPPFANIKDSKLLHCYVEEAMESESYGHNSDTNEENAIFEEFEPT